MPKGKPHGPPAPPDIKKTINRYYDECREKQPGKSKEYCARVAWTRFCQHKDPDHPSCKTNQTMEAVGRGMGRGGMGNGPDDGACVCPSCGHMQPHTTGETCMDMTCSKCGTKMTRESFGRPFSSLFALLEGQPHHDGEVERKEFNTLGASAPLDAEARQAMTDFVLERLPPSRTFMTAKNETGVVYYDSRGRAVQATFNEIDDGELRRLAERLGFNNEQEPATPEMPDDFVEPTADNTASTGGIVMADLVSIVRG